MAAAAPPQPDTVSHVSEALSGHATDEYDLEDPEDSRMEGGHLGNSMRDKDRKIGHRRVDKAGIVSYKKFTTQHCNLEPKDMMERFGFGVDKFVWYTVSDLKRYYDLECNQEGPDLDNGDAWLQEWLKRVKPTSELMAAIQLGIGQSVGGLSSKPERDVLMQDFGVVEVVFFPGEGSNLTPAHHYSDFRFKTYAPVAFRYFRDLFGIQPDDFMLSLCDQPLKELSNPGASGSIFYLTHDDEFITKTVQHKEADFLQKLLPGYFLNISQNKRTLLPKFYGLYCYQCGGKNIRFTVMNNLLPSTVKLHEKYDMKGSTYKRKASKHERSKNSPTLKDLDFMENHPDGLQLEKDTYDALIKTLQRDCRVLESFKIMDYSLLVGIYNLDIVNKEKQASQQTGDKEYPAEMGMSGSGGAVEGGTTPASGNNALQRGKSFKTRIGQYSTPMESIQGNTELAEDLLEDEDVPPGGIPARNAKGERLLLYLGIIDILQSYRFKKKIEHTVKSIVTDGDTVSVHRPSYYAQRFLQFHATRVFRKTPTALKHSPSKKRSLVNKSRGQPPIPEQSEGGGGGGMSHRPEKAGRTISFSDDPPSVGSGAVGGKPDLLPEYSRMPAGGSARSPSPRTAAHNINGNSRHQKRSEAFNLSSYPSEDALSAGTASTASLRAVGTGYPPSGPRGPSPPLSLSESTPTHTDFTEGTPSFTNSSPSCSSDVMDMGSSNPLETGAVDSPARSPAPSPDLRYHTNKPGKGGTPQAGGRVSAHTAGVVVMRSEHRVSSDVTVKVTPESPQHSRSQAERTVTTQLVTAAPSAPSTSATARKTSGTLGGDSESTATPSTSSSTPTGPTVAELSATESEMTRL